MGFHLIIILSYLHIIDYQKSLKIFLDVTEEFWKIVPVLVVKLKFKDFPEKTE